MRTVTPIERVTRTRFEPRATHAEPYIVEGAVNDWPACTAWTETGLRERLGSLPTSFKVSRSHKHPDFGAEDLATTFATERGSFAELLDRIAPPSDEAARYLLTGSEEFLMRRDDAGSIESNHKLVGLLADCDPSFVPVERLRSSWFWLSGAGVRTWLHYDNNGCDNANAQIRGRKVVHAFHPDDLASLYPFPFGGPNPAYNCCAVDFERPDPARFPAFAGVRAWRGEVEPGDLLVLPANWIHTFEHVGSFNVNVNYWWTPVVERDSVVARRQRVLDEAAAREPLDDAERREFARLDREAIGRPGGR